MKLNTQSIRQSVLSGLFLIIFSHFLSAQSIGVSSGVGMFSFMDFGDDNEHLIKDYQSGGHQFIKLDLINYFPDAPFFKLSLNLERSNGYINVENQFDCFCGNGCFGFSNRNINADFTIYRVGLRFMPININVYRGFRFGLGTELSKTLRSFEDSRQESQPIVNTIFPTGLNDEESIVQDMGVGIVMELQFGEVLIGRGIRMNPMYSLGISLTDEIDSGHNIKSIRQAIGFAFVWDLKPRNLLVN